MSLGSTRTQYFHSKDVNQFQYINKFTKIIINDFSTNVFHAVHECVYVQAVRSCATSSIDLHKNDEQTHAQCNMFSNAL